jgi:Tfp pilus assembly protein PilO
MKRQVSFTPVVGIALVIVAVSAYMLLIRPKAAESARLSDEIAQLEQEVAAAETAARPKQPGSTIKVADLFRLAKAMPDEDDMPGIILELNSVASAAGVDFRSISPQTSVAKEGYTALPISLTFEGNYFDLTDFLFRLRNLVIVRDGKLQASGRLFTLDSLDMHQGRNGFPQIEAVLVISAYVYGGSAGTTTPVAATTGASTTTTTADSGASATGGAP